jgi:hypothetical protein
MAQEVEATKPALDFVEQKLYESLGTALDYVQKGTDFVAEQAPLVIQEMLRWEIGSNTFLAVFWALIAFGSYKLVRYTIAYPRTNTSKYSDLVYYDIDYVFQIVGVAAAMILSPFFTLGYVYNLMYVLLAPRLFLIDRITSLIQKVT